MVDAELEELCPADDGQPIDLEAALDQIIGDMAFAEEDSDEENDGEAKRLA